ncbi:MAG: hypothetical protein EA418_05840 [Wenzhouxiangellaceae bacterium]|nr:MAG: hypothetical protein EA418_05840 [Wenzhouxiangellaceae bacterium]
MKILHSSLISIAFVMLVSVVNAQAPEEGELDEALIEALEVEQEVIEDALLIDESDQPAESDPEAEPTQVIEAGAANPETALTEIINERPETTTGEAGAELGSRVFRIQAHPIYTPDQAESVYQPLINYLNAATEFQFELQIARDFHRYWLDIRRGLQPDLVLEDAHIIAMRMIRDGYVPLVRADSPGSFSLLTSGMNMDAELADFVGRPVSSMPAPSLGYLILASWYDNPMQQPVIQSNASSWLDAVEIVFSMEAEAAIVPHNLVARYVNMEIVQTSDSFPHSTIAASPQVPAIVQRAIIDALTVLHEDNEFFPALHELDIDAFVPATAEEYQGMERWLDEVFTFR